MKVLLLSPYPELIEPTLDDAGDTYYSCIERHDFDQADYDFIISFGYRKIIKEPFLTLYKNRIINMHISMLPWNRGADPNFWSWFDDTPKGVTIHRIDAGIDTGSILVQEQTMGWRRKETLASSWSVLMNNARLLFQDNWKTIRRDGLGIRNVVGGTYHNSRDKEDWMEQLPLGWDTPVVEVKRLGIEYRKQNETKDRNPRPRKYRQQTFKEF